MGTTYDRATIARLALSFLVDRVGMDADATARAAGMTPAELAAALRGTPPAEGTEAARSVDGIAAIQSMLLSAYTPEGAATWLRTASPLLEGRIPAIALASGRVGDVLAAAVARVAV